MRRRSTGSCLYSRLWGTGFLPSKLQGVALRAKGDPVLFLSNPRGVDRKVRRRMLDTMGEVNRQHQAAIGDPEVAHMPCFNATARERTLDGILDAVLQILTELLESILPNEFALEDLHLHPAELFGR